MLFQQVLKLANRRVVKITAISAVLMMPRVVLACDSCAKLAIQEGFAKLNENAQLIKAAVDNMNSQVVSLKNQVDTSGQKMVSAVDNLGNTLSDTLNTNSDRINNALAGLFTQLSNQFFTLSETSKNYTLELQNDLTNDFSSAEKLIRLRDAQYEPGGDLANFRGGEIADGLLQLYTSNSSFVKGVYAIHSKFITRWNQKDPALFQNGKDALFHKLSKQVVDNGDTLISALNTQSILTLQQYQDLVYYTAFALNPDRIDTLDPNFLKIVAKQAELLRQIVDKAPIIPVSDKNLKFFGVYAPEVSDTCPKELVENKMIPAGTKCTSTDAIITALVARGGSPSFMVAGNMASKRALDAEQLRTSILSNIIQKRLLDAERGKNVLGTM